MRTWGHFAADVARARKSLAGAVQICNLMSDRYQFMVGLSAAMLNGQTTVLPSARAPGAIRLALDETVESTLLGVSDPPGLASRSLSRLTEGDEQADPAPLSEALARAPGPVHVCTSGSTGEPVAHVKRWPQMFGGACLSEQLIQRAGLPAGTTAVLCTTPHQHMYGLEAGVFTGLGYGRMIYRGAVFYPQDLVGAAAHLAGQGIDTLALVTSPVHLKFLEPTVRDLPAIRMVLSATAPLPRPMAQRIEAEGGPPVYEIYGSTETGSLAWRQTTQSDDWQAGNGFTLAMEGQRCIASAPHMTAPIPLGDAVDLRPGGRFALLGRLGDMVNVAGKRANLGALNAVLIEAPGLSDGVIVRTRRDEGDLLSVVAVRDRNASLSETEIKAAIRRHMQAHFDPVFVPRQVVFAEALPRSETGKISARDIESLANDVASAATMS